MAIIVTLDLPARVPSKRADALDLVSNRFHSKEISKNALDEIIAIKKKDRTELPIENWAKLGYAYTDMTNVLLNNCPDQITRLDFDSIDEETFRNEFEIPSRPCVFKGGDKDFLSNRYWNWQRIYDDFGESKMKIGEDDDGHKLRTKLKYFMEYMVHQNDDSPLYLFESSLENMKKGGKFESRIKVGESRRPPHKWFLIGPERSGTTIHQDPISTNAWNISFRGHKRWVLIPKDVPKSIAKGKEFLTKGEDDEALSYFAFILPKIQKKEREHLRSIEFIQYPGRERDTVFVPGGWWHAVVNLDDTMAYTQNYCSTGNFISVWSDMRKDRKRLACKFLDQLKIKRKDLYEIAVQINKQDHFLMYDELMNKRERRYYLEDNIERLPLKRRKLSDSTDNNSESSSSSSSSSSNSSSSSYSSSSDSKSE